MKDPIIETIRQARNKHAKKFNFNIKAIVKDLKNKENDLKKTKSTKHCS